MIVVTGMATATKKPTARTRLSTGCAITPRAIDAQKPLASRREIEHPAHSLCTGHGYGLQLIESTDVNLWLTLAQTDKRD